MRSVLAKSGVYNKYEQDCKNTFHGDYRWLRANVRK